jgi:hypothetical protein
VLGRKGGFLTATVSDYSPKGRLYQQKNLFGFISATEDFGFYYSAVLAQFYYSAAALAFTIQKGIPYIFTARVLVFSIQPNRFSLLKFRFLHC